MPQQETPLLPARRRWILPVLLLPMNILVFIPAILLWFSGYQWQANHPALLFLGIVLLFTGLSLAAWTMHLFHTLGQGTAGPWDAPRRLVVAGPYRHLRNPMLFSVFIMQTAEALLLASWALAGLLVVFVIANAIYFPFVEEKTLERRFGEDYLVYKRHVPRWLPRLHPWNAE